MCCEGKIPNTLANNPWPNAYLVAVLPPPVGVTYTLAVPWLFQLRADEALVMVGNTPPAVRYYSYQTFATSIPGLPGATGVAVGDTINISTVNTLGPDRFNQPIVYILTANRTTEQLVRAAVHAAAYPDEIVNVEPLAPVIAPPGYGPNGSTYYLAHRATVAESQETLNAYIKNPPYRVFRVTPSTPLAADPEPVPVLRVQGTGHTEMELFPAVRRLRQAILDKYAGKKALEYRTNVQVEDPYPGLQQQLSEYGATRDTNYLSSYPNFYMPDTLDQFVIVYGVNHRASGKATYASISIYADATRLFGIDTIFDRDYAGSAAQYLPPGDPDADKLFAVKLARRCNSEPFCFEIKQPDFVDINDQPYACTPPLDLNAAEIFLVFRGYMEPATMVGPDKNEIVYERVIMFGPPHSNYLSAIGKQ